MNSILNNKLTRLFLILAGFIISNALIAELIGVKIFSVEKIFGLSPYQWEIFGVENIGLSMSAGVLLWPVVFVMTDIINEYYGVKGVKLLSYLTVGLILYSFVR